MTATRGGVALDVYLAGPMTGYPNYNVVAFDRVKRQLERELCVKVTTPFDTNSDVWEQHYGRHFDPYKDQCDYGDPILREMMAADFDELLQSDIVVVLDGWQQSKGAQAEVIVAINAGIRVEDERGNELHIRPVISWAPVGMPL